MEYIKKEEVTNYIQRFIDARKNKQCSKQAIVEKTAFEYALVIVNKCEVFNFED